ncbi:MAG: hypothetical protein OK457_01830 [Thaumarchaeota archaeon]|nr:hypothetical protein [Nitrososphaerota archaeon]
MAEARQRVQMPEDHKTVFLSITATVIAGLLILGATIAINGGSFSLILFKQYVLPLIISAFTLFVFFVVLLVNNTKAARKTAAKAVVKA